MFGLFISDIINRYTGPDKLSKFIYTDDNNKYLILMRYLLLVIQLKIKDSVELHLPRNTSEYFTYQSDKLWSKIIYAIMYINENNDPMCYNNLLHYIHVGGCVNLVKYWFYHLNDKKYSEKELVRSDIKYHMQSTGYSLYYDSYNFHLKFDKIITECIFYIKDYINLNNDDIYIQMLTYILNSEMVSNNLLTDYKKYLNRSYIDPSNESLNKYDMLNLIYDNMEC